MQTSFKDIQEYLSIRRAEKGLSQEQMVGALFDFHAEFSNIDSQTISRWELGKISPSIPRQVLLMQFFKDEPHTLLADSGFAIRQLPTLAAFERLLDSNMEFSHVLGAHPYADKSLEVEKYPVSAEGSESFAKRVAGYQVNLSRGRDVWDIDQLMPLIQFPSTMADYYKIGEVWAGHSLVLRLKPQILDAVLTFEIADHELTIEHLAQSDEDGDIYSLSGYSGTREIQADMNAYVLTAAAQEKQQCWVGIKARTDFGLRLLELVGAERVAVGQRLSGKKEGLKYHGHRYDCIGFKLSRDALLSNSLYINLARTYNLEKG